MGDVAVTDARSVQSLKARSSRLAWSGRPMLLVSMLPLLVPVTVAVVPTLSAQQAPQTRATTHCWLSSLRNP
jgi:hypothetical protein